MENCSYLGIVAALSSEADYLFVPEMPVELDWETSLCNKLQQVYLLLITSIVQTILTKKSLFALCLLSSELILVFQSGNLSLYMIDSKW